MRLCATASSFVTLMLFTEVLESSLRAHAFLNAATSILCSKTGSIGGIWMPRRMFRTDDQAMMKVIQKEVLIFIRARLIMNNHGHKQSRCDALT
jgi:hypothetical protein